MPRLFFGKVQNTKTLRTRRNLFTSQNPKTTPQNITTHTNLVFTSTTEQKLEK